MTEIEDYANRLRLSNQLREPAIQAAVLSLRLPNGSRGLDVGCGIGLHTPLLAQAVGTGGQVTGVDVSPEFLVLAGDYVEQLGLSAQITFQPGDLRHLPFADQTFDWVWCADTLHPGLMADPLAASKELARVVKPGGMVAVCYWSSQMLLPGSAALEARLQAAFVEVVPYLKVPPEWSFLNALGWLREAGLTDLRARTFTADVYAPLSAEIRSALTMSFQMFWGGLRDSVRPEDWAEFERLCQPESPDFMLNRQDYYAFLTYSLFCGRVV